MHPIDHAQPSLIHLQYGPTGCNIDVGHTRLPSRHGVGPPRWSCPLRPPYNAQDQIGLPFPWSDLFEVPNVNALRALGLSTIVPKFPYNP